MFEESWSVETTPLRVRMGLHTGESRQRAGDYYGANVNRAARVMGLANGGQVLISGATAALIRTALPPDVTLSDLGEHRLRGLAVRKRFRSHVRLVCRWKCSSNWASGLRGWRPQL